MAVEYDLPFYICLAGPTASGKTAAALAIAQAHAVEIISVDSALVYRGLDIGTAKPSAAELATVPHHLISIRDPLETYSAAEFVSDARRLIQDIHARGRLPLLVGGTMLYFKALLNGLDDMPSADASTRAAIAKEAAAQGWPALHAQLAQIDALTAARLAPNDAQRIARALEVFRVSGRPLSSFHQQTAIKNRSQSAEKARPMTLISLEPSDRSWLHARIAQRFEAMLQAGFMAEVQALRARGDLHADLPALRCVGYRQAWALLDNPAQSPESLLTRWRELATAATRQLAKRQITWLRSMPTRQVLACDGPDALEQVLARVRDSVRVHGFHPVHVSAY